MLSVTNSSDREPIAFIPLYDKTGANVTKILFSNGDIEIAPYPLKNYINRFLAHYHLDKKSMSYWVNNIIGVKNSAPLIINDTFAFIPVLMRRAISPNDGCTGYVRLNAIQSIGKYTLKLSNGTVLEVLISPDCVQRKVRQTRNMINAYLIHRKPNNFMNEPYGI